MSKDLNVEATIDIQGRSLKVGALLALGLPLRIIDSSQDIDPSLSGVGEGVKFDTVNEGGGSSRNALSSSILPDGPSLVLSGVRIVRSVVDAKDIVDLETKLISDHLRPVGNELVLGVVGEAEDVVLVFEAKVKVVVEIGAIVLVFDA